MQAPEPLRRALLIGAACVMLLAAIPRLVIIPRMTAFADELIWIQDGHEALQKLRHGPITPKEWGPKLIRHPGVPVAIAAGLAEASRDPTKDRVDEDNRILALGRYGVVWTGILACGLLTALAGVLYGAPTGLVAGLVLAASPFHIANSGWLQCDSALALFSITSVLMLLIYRREGRYGWIVGSAASAGLAVVSKLPGLLLFGFVGLVLGVDLLVHLAKRRPNLRRRFLDLGLWMAVAPVTIYVFWPRLWLDPREMWTTIEWGRKLGETHLNYFMGKITSTPPWYYYLVVAPFSLSSLELAGLVGAAGSAAVGLFRRRRPTTESLLILLWAAIFLAAMSVSGKKLGARYVLALWPVFAVGIARFVVIIGEPLYLKLKGRARRGALLAAGGAYLAIAAATIALSAPDLFAASPRLLGGLAGLNRITLVTGVAEKTVAAYLDTLPAADRVRVAGHTETLRWHARRTLESEGCGAGEPRALKLNPPVYLAVFSYQEQRCPSLAPAMVTGAGGREIRAFSWDGAVLCRIYQFNVSSPPRANAAGLRK